MTELTDLNDTDALNTAVTGESTVGNVANMGNMDNLQQAILGMLSRFRNANIFRLRDNSDNTKLLAFDLSGLTTATTRTVTVPDRSGTMALSSDITNRRNRIVNGDMRVSQENVTTAGTANGYYPVDQWAQYRVTSAGTLTVAQVASVTPAGSPNRLRATVTVADASLAAGEFWKLTQNLEGSNVADFQYGGSSAKASVLRFGFKGPAGTYAARVGNSAANRSFVALFTITAGQANTDTVQTVAITGDTTGTWLTANGVIGMTLDIVLACGSTFQGVAGWQAGNLLGTSAVSNGMGTGSAVFELFDVGLKLDPDATGVYGAYEAGETDAVYRSERYYEKSYDQNVRPGAITIIGAMQQTSFTGNISQTTFNIQFSTRKCKQPTVNPYSTQTGAIDTIYDATAAADRAATAAIAGETTAVIVNTALTNSNDIHRMQWTAWARLV